VSRRVLAATAAAMLAAGALSCGEVPTLEGGIAYISPVVLPAPAVAVGDQLRDSLGNVAPLRVIAYDRSDVEIPDVPASFVPVTVPVPITIGEDGTVTASDTVTAVQTVQIVGRVGDRLQTTPATLLVVTQPDSMVNSSAAALSTTLPALDTMRVVVTGVNSFGASRVAVPGIVVRYRIAGVFGTGTQGLTTVLTLDGRTISRPDSLAAVDTTDSFGETSRTLVVAGTGVDSVVVYARARSLRGVPLRGDSLRFILRVKSSTP
jgi:hypothetical protein